MHYSTLNVDLNGRLTQSCPICGNEKPANNYCSVCGPSILNRCSNATENPFDDNCDLDTHLEGHERYCSKCGSKSTFFKMDY